MYWPDLLYRGVKLLRLRFFVHVDLFLWKSLLGANISVASGQWVHHEGERARSTRHEGFA